MKTTNKALVERLQKMQNNTLLTPNVWRIQHAYRQITKEYPTAIIAGGSIVDCIYGKPFFDIDVFVHGRDLDDKYRGRIGSKGVLEVRKMYINNMPLDIVVLDRPLEDQVKRFDLAIKQCWYDGTFHFTQACLDDVLNNRLTITRINCDANYFRYVRTATKYGLDYTKDITPLRDYLTDKVLKGKKIYVSDKYTKDVDILLNTTFEETPNDIWVTHVERLIKHNK